MNRLQKLQSKCLRNVLNVNKYTSSNEMLNVVNCLSVKQIIVFRTMIFVRKIIDGKVPKYLTERIKYKNNGQPRVLRNSNEIELVRATMACSQNSLFYRGIQMYNSLPIEIRSESSDTSFETKLKKYVKERIQ